MKHKLFHSRRIWRLLIIIGVDGIFFGLTDPARVASIVLIVGYGLIIITLYYLLELVLQVLAIASGSKRLMDRRLRLVLTALAAILLGLQSVGQLSARDVAAIVPLGVLCYAYLVYSRRRAV